MCAILKISLNGACVWLTPLTDLFGGKIRWTFQGGAEGVGGGGGAKVRGKIWGKFALSVLSYQEVRSECDFTAWTAEGGTDHFHEGRNS